MPRRHTSRGRSSCSDSLGAIDRFYKALPAIVSWNYPWSGASYEIADDTGSDLVDQRMKKRASAEYHLTPYLVDLGPLRAHNFCSTDEASDFLENELRIGVRIRH